MFAFGCATTERAEDSAYGDRSLPSSLFFAAQPRTRSWGGLTHIAKTENGFRRAEGMQLMRGPRRDRCATRSACSTSWCAGVRPISLDGARSLLGIAIRACLMSCLDHVLEVGAAEALAELIGFTRRGEAAQWCVGSWRGAGSVGGAAVRHDQATASGCGRARLRCFISTRGASS